MMPVYTFDAFVAVVAAYEHNRGDTAQAVITGLLEEDELPYKPNFVVDHCDHGVGHNDSDVENLFSEMEAYAHLDFQGDVFMAPDHSTVYFEKEDDAVLFYLAAA